MLPFLSFVVLYATSAVNGAHLGVHHPQVQRSLPNIDLISAAWYAGWHSADYPLSVVPWHKYTHLSYSFAETTEDVNILSLNGSDSQVLPAFVAEAKKNHVKAIVTVGGWTGSQFFSSAIATSQNRTAFVKTITKFAAKYQLDGIDFDWEYPGNQGIGCNTVSPSDSANFLNFLQLLRRDPVGQQLIISAATPLLPWVGPDGNPLADVSEFAKVFDYIAIMNYDVNGPWLSYVGPNAPLDDSCAPADNQQGSAITGVKAWTAAGMPIHKIVLGVASYGHSYTVHPEVAFGGNGQALVPFPTFDSSLPPDGDAWDDAAGFDECGNYNPPGGNFDFWGLITGGFLNKDGTVAKGIYSRWDACSQTPYVYNKTSQVMVSFDNARSFAVKGAYIKQNNLRGFAIWEAGGDSHQILLDSILEAAGS